MELTNKILDTALLSELAYLKLENKYFENKPYSLGNITGFLRDNNKDITGIDDNRDSAIIDLLKNYTIIDFKNIPKKRKKRGQATLNFLFSLCLLYQYLQELK